MIDESQRVKSMFFSNRIYITEKKFRVIFVAFFELQGTNENLCAINGGGVPNELVRILNVQK